MRFISAIIFLGVIGESSSVTHKHRHRHHLHHKQYIQSNGFDWIVVESLSLHETIKYGGKDRDKYIRQYILSMKNLLHKIKTTKVFLKQ